jgi:hypothetical protein
MKRIVGSFLMLAGLSGCISFTNPPDARDKTTEMRTPGVLSSPVNAARFGGAPACSYWQADPSRPANAPLGDYRNRTTFAAAWPPAPSNPIPSRPVAPTTAPIVTQPEIPLPPRPVAIKAATLRAPEKPSDGPCQGSVALAAGAATASEVSTPPVAPPADSGVVQTSFSTTSQPPEPKVASNKVALEAPAKKAIPLPPMPVHDAADGKVARTGAPLMRLVNSKRITLNFEVKDVGPSGVSGVELWYTRDCREWRKYEAPLQPKAYVVEVDDEGMYGFTLLARSGIGLGKAPPAPGDQPQVWVIVDLTRPEVHLAGVTPGVDQKQQQVTLTWSASDKNLARHPVSLFWSEKPEGPWKVMAANLENTGKYVWKVPTTIPPSFLVKVEAADLAGNIGSDQSGKPVLLDTRVPSVCIVNVEATDSH